MKERTTQRLQLPDAEIADLYRDGARLVDLSVRFGVSTSTIANRLREQDVKIRPGHAPEIRLPDAEIADLYRKGMATTEIATLFGVSAPLIRRRLRRQGVKWRYHGGPPVRVRRSLPDDVIARKYRAGMTLTDLAKRFSVSHMEIKRRLEEQGIDRRSRGPEAGRLPASMIRKIVEAHLQGAPVDAISWQLCVSSSVVRQTLIERGLLPKPRQRHPAERTLLRLRSEGRTLEDIARRTGVSQTTVKRRLNRLGVPTDQPQKQEKINA